MDIDHTARLEQKKKKEEARKWAAIEAQQRACNAVMSAAADRLDFEWRAQHGRKP